MKKPEKFWDFFARLESKKTLNKELGPSKVFQLTEKHLKADDIVMDFGCGPGGMAYRMAKRVKQVYGIDFSNQTIQNAKNRILGKDVQNIHFMRATIFDKRHINGSFDVITSFYVLHMVDEPNNVIKKIGELLKPGGIFISATPCMGEKRSVLAASLRLFNKIGLVPHVNAFKISELQTLMEGNALEVIDKEKLTGSFSEHYFVAKKV